MEWCTGPDLLDALPSDTPPMLRTQCEKLRDALPWIKELVVTPPQAVGESPCLCFSGIHAESGGIWFYIVAKILGQVPTGKRLQNGQREFCPLIEWSLSTRGVEWPSWVTQFGTTSRPAPTPIPTNGALLESAAAAPDIARKSPTTSNPGSLIMAILHHLPPPRATEALQTISDRIPCLDRLAIRDSSAWYLYGEHAGQRLRLLLRIPQPSEIYADCLAEMNASEPSELLLVLRDELMHRGIEPTEEALSEQLYVVYSEKWEWKFQLVVDPVPGQSPVDITLYSDRGSSIISLVAYVEQYCSRFYERNSSVALGTDAEVYDEDDEDEGEGGGEEDEEGDSAMDLSSDNTRVVVSRKRRAVRGPNDPIFLGQPPPLTTFTTALRRAANTQTQHEDEKGQGDEDDDVIMHDVD